MKAATASVWDNGDLDPYARGQVGWWDQDCDKILDPLDPAIIDQCQYIYLPITVKDYVY